MYFATNQLSLASFPGQEHARGVDMVADLLGETANSRRAAWIQVAAADATTIALEDYWQSPLTRNGYDLPD